MGIFLLFTITNLYSARIKDIATIEGVSGIQVIGYGLVSGLNQTGDNQLTSFTVQSVSNMLKRFGLTMPQNNPRMRNVAAVMVTTTIPTFSKPGAKIDVQVSSIGDATSLQGGILLMTPLSTATGDIVGMAQGALSVGGFDYRSLGSRLGRNFVTSGRVPNGLILNNESAQFLKSELITSGNKIRISLRDPDITTSVNIAEAINKLADMTDKAVPIDAGTVEVELPANLSPMQLMKKISDIESDNNVQADPVARVVINERTGTVVVGGKVELLPAVISHGGLEISIQRQVIVPQPAPFSVYPPRAEETATINVEEEINPARVINVESATVQDMANSLNLLQVKPRDLIAIFQALKEAGSLMGELIIQ